MPHTPHGTTLYSSNQVSIKVKLSSAATHGPLNLLYIGLSLRQLARQHNHMHETSCSVIDTVVSFKSSYSEVTETVTDWSPATSNASCVISHTVDSFRRGCCSCIRKKGWIICILVVKYLVFIIYDEAISSFTFLSTINSLPSTLIT